MLRLRCDSLDRLLTSLAVVGGWGTKGWVTVSRWRVSEDVDSLVDRTLSKLLLNVLARFVTLADMGRLLEWFEAIG